MKQPVAVQISGRQIRSIWITRPGWAFILLTLGLGAGGLNSGNNLLYLLFGMLLSMLVINAILSRSSLADLRVQFRLPQRLYAQTGNPIHIEIHNSKKRLPSYAITLQPAIGPRRYKDAGYFAFKITPGGSVAFVHPHSFEERGRHRLPGFRITTSYPFGLIEKYIPVEIEGERVVYPKLNDGARDFAIHASRHGDFLSGRCGVGVNPYGVREYVHGDDIRRLHWPSVAKVGNWMTKEFEQEKTPKVVFNLLVQSGAATDDDARDKRERTVTAVATLLVHSSRLNREVGLMINSQPVESTGSGYLDFYLTALALFDHEDETPLPSATSAAERAPDGAVIALSELPQASLSPTTYDLLIFENGAPA